MCICCMHMFRLNDSALTFTSGSKSGGHTCVLQYKKDKKLLAARNSAGCFCLVVCWIGFIMLSKRKINVLMLSETEQTLCFSCFILMWWKSTMQSFWSDGEGLHLSGETSL